MSRVFLLECGKAMLLASFCDIANVSFFIFYFGLNLKQLLRRTQQLIPGAVAYMVGFGNVESLHLPRVGTWEW